MLSCLLLSSLIFSATFGVLHHHSPNASRLSTVESTNVNTVSPAGENGSSNDKPLQSKDCSICQLLGHLSGGLLYAPVFTPAPPVEHFFEFIVSIPYLSAPNNTRRGRAPPQTSL
jgi:hypothetical protein